MKVAILLALVGTVLCRATREKRQVACQEPAIPNVCTSGVAGRIYFPHPIDSTKFLQCADGGRMFIIKCPAGEMYDSGRSSCYSPQIQTTTPAPFSHLCTATNVANNNIFFPYPGDVTRFIECNGVGQPMVLSCPSKLIYDGNRQSCVLQGSTGTGTVATQPPVVNPGTNTGTGGTVSTNPCTVDNIANNNLLFPHPDPTKFIQCDLAGDVYVMTCPAGLYWNQRTQNCATAYQAAGNTLTG